jgi:iron-sulfur cluster assembly accessory protein
MLRFKSSRSWLPSQTIKKDFERMPNVVLTPAAAEKVVELLDKEGLAGQKDLRVFVQGGGCAGMSYGMVFDEPDAEEDLVVESNGVRLLLDSMSASMLGGTEIDYVDGLMGQGFTFSNPNAKGSCACGHSFSTENSEVRSGGCASGGCGH